MDYYNFNTQQGWQCPICKRVYSPNTMMCYYCGNGNTTTETTHKFAIDYTHKNNLTEINKKDKNFLDK